MLPLAAVFWVRLVEQRLGVQLYSEEELPFPLPPAEEEEEVSSAPPPPPEAGAGSAAAATAIEGPIVLNKAKKARTG